MLVNLYVDDLLIVAERSVLRKAVAKMGERFSTKGDICGDSFSYVGLAVMRDRAARKIYVNQTGLITC